MDRCRASIRYEAEACVWLTEQVRDGKLKLSWVESSPEYQHGLYLRGESFIHIPCFPAAQAIDELDWHASLLRRRVRYPNIVDRWGGSDPSELTYGDLLRRDEELRSRLGYNALTALYQAQRVVGAGDGPNDWITEEQKFLFSVDRALLSGILDTVSRDIPETDRAEGESGECGCWREVAEEQEARQTAADILAAYRTKVRFIPQLVEERRQSDQCGSLVFVNRDYEVVIKAELRAPLKAHFDRQLRVGKWVCYGFSEERGERVRVGSPWRDGLAFDDLGGMSDKRGNRYSDVLFYRATSAIRMPPRPLAVQTPAVAPNPVLSQSEKEKLRRRVKEFIERETKIDPPRAGTKAEWLQLCRQEFGTDRVTDNLFDGVWRDADLPLAWRAPGRRT